MGPLRVVNGPTNSGPNPARTQKYKPEPGPNPKTNSKPESCPKKPKVKLSHKNLAMLPNYFGYIFMHLRQKVRLRPELSPKFLSTSGPNPARTRPEPGPNPTWKAWPDLQLWARYPTTKMPPTIKRWQKVFFSQFQYLSASSRTTVDAYNSN